MAGRIIGFVCALVCAFPFYLIPYCMKGSNTPINFWSGDTTLKSKVKNIPQYNLEMTALYHKYGLSFLAAGIGFLIMPEIGAVIICLACSIGLYLLYRGYKRILEENS